MTVKARFTEYREPGNSKHRVEKHFTEEYVSICNNWMRDVMLRIYETNKVIYVCVWVTVNQQELLGSARVVVGSESHKVQRKWATLKAFQSAGIMFDDGFQDVSEIANYVEAAALLVNGGTPVFVHNAHA